MSAITYWYERFLVLDSPQTAALGGCWFDCHGEAIELHPKSHHQPAKNKRRWKKKNSMFTSTFQLDTPFKYFYWLKDLEFKIPQQMSSPRNVCFNSFSWGHSRGHFFLHLGKNLLTGLVLFTHKKRVGGGGVHFSSKSQSSVITLVCLFFCNSQSRKRLLKSQNCGSQADIFLCWQRVKYNDGKQYVSQEGWDWRCGYITQYHSHAS